MKSWRNGFMRCSSRDEPCGSHHVDARALKCETSSGDTEDAFHEVDANDRAWKCFRAKRGPVRSRRDRCCMDWEDSAFGGGILLD